MLSVLLATALVRPAADVLPDVSLLPSYLAQAYFTTSNPELPPGTPALRFPTASVNYGPGRLELRGGEVVGSQQRVYQRVFRSDGTTYDREAGWFVYHPSHGHIHFQEWTQFILRSMNKDGGVGEVVATGAKTSFCILELLDWDNTVAGHNTAPSYSSCGQVQGLRPGWSDVYGASLDGQYINLTGVPNGDYWLQGFIDPNGQVLESSETNNSVLVPVSIGTPPTAVADSYETNNSIAEVDGMVPGGPNSANFGKIGHKLVIRSLSMHDTQDWFKFQMTHTGGLGDYVRIESPWTRTGNLDLQLYNSAGQMVLQAAASYNYEQISLKQVPAGVYYVKVVRNGSTNNPRYWLTIEPSGSAPPLSTVYSPPSNGPETGPPAAQLAYETIPIEWKYPTKTDVAASVTLFKSRTLNDMDAVSIDGYVDIPGHVQRANILTNQFTPGDWYIFARFTKGAAHHDSWLPKSYMVYIKGDTDFNGKATVEEAQELYHKYIKVGRSVPTRWKPVCDMDEDGDVDLKDYQLMYKAAEHGH